MEHPFEITPISSLPFAAAAIHHGHSVRREIAGLFALNESERLREEDPFTGYWAEIAETRIINHRSRFEADVNRQRDTAVYLRPEDAWGLRVWKDELPQETRSRSLEYYDSFYASARELLSEMERTFGKFIVFDLHTYNHRREGPDGPSAEPDGNPEVNIGTGTMDRERWAPVVERFIRDLRGFDYFGRHLDVRENIKFRGGNFSKWIHTSFPASGCALAIEFKKFFMDEWTGSPDRAQLEGIYNALKQTVPGVLEELRSL